MCKPNYLPDLGYPLAVLMVFVYLLFDKKEFISLVVLSLNNFQPEVHRMLDRVSRRDGIVYYGVHGFSLGDIVPLVAMIAQFFKSL